MDYLSNQLLQIPLPERLAIIEAELIRRAAEREMPSETAGEEDTAGLILAPSITVYLPEL